MKVWFDHIFWVTFSHCFCILAHFVAWQQATICDYCYYHYNGKHIQAYILSLDSCEWLTLKTRQHAQKWHLNMMSCTLSHRKEGISQGVNIICNGPVRASELCSQSSFWELLQGVITSPDAALGNATGKSDPARTCVDEFMNVDKACFYFVDFRKVNEFLLVFNQY